MDWRRGIQSPSSYPAERDARDSAKTLLAGFEGWMFKHEPNISCRFVFINREEYNAIALMAKLWIEEVSITAEQGR